MSPAAREAEFELRRLVESIHFENPVAVTLTMKKRAGSQAADSIVASNNFRHFRNRLEHAILGSAAKRHGRRLSMIAVLEMSADHRLHYHCTIDRPYHCSFERLSNTIREQWQKTDFGYRQVDIQDQPDTGWTDYILKQRQKGSLFDSIDWANCQLIAE
ncbi:hypothetical protein [Bradyrhizobium sp. AUGA SZCCT0169]|uniref:rolling circle replication-associated protein n=1 Tax=Bradyrhizobium sp. AUGA SZCCT0169 TaxID=2807663 RepID=UPI001BA6AC6F|nr:hypothetical protein [Bradyrhizobium sp. AUGA SZCCT0169]